MELLITIVHFVEGRRELSRLCRTCRLFRTLVEPKLYQGYFVHSEWFKKAGIPQVIRHKRVELILTTVTLELYSWKYCGQGTKWWHPTSLKKLNRREDPCTCDKLDESMGSSLRHLVNLTTLRLDCELCDADSHTRHGWVSMLETKSLKEINLVCWCSRMDENRTIEALSAPAMKSVTTLGWHPYRSISQTEGQLEEFLIKGSVLPNLRYLDHWGNDTDGLLLRHRPITRLSCSLDPGCTLNYEDMKEKQGMTHLNIQCIEWGAFGSLYLNAIAEDLNPFRNLQHIGAFTLTSSSSVVGYDNSCSDGLED
jgi:hypothetical protein